MFGSTSASPTLRGRRADGQGPVLRRLARAHRGDRYGASYFVRRMLQRRKTDFEGKRVVVSGSGTSRFYTIEKIWLRRQGRRLLRIPTVRGRRGRIDLDLVKENQGAARARISEYARLKKTGTHYIEGGSIRDVRATVAMASATQNEINGKSAAPLIKIGVKRWAKAPTCRPRGGGARFREAGVLFARASGNAGAWATSASEMQQNASRDSGPSSAPRRSSPAS